MITLGVLALFFAGALALGFSLGWKALKPRMATIHEGFQHREQDYDAARPMAADYPVFGTGPGTFENVSQLYRISTAAIGLRNCTTTGWKRASRSAGSAAR